MGEMVLDAAKFPGIVSLQRLFPATPCRPHSNAPQGDTMPSPLSKSALIESITKLQTDGTTKRQTRSVIEALVAVGHKELKKNGMFLVPGFAKFVVIKKPATKARKGINPFTKEPTVFKAKPARKVVKARPVKAVKDAIA
jgi:DNA-binding protein HU-beta